MPQFLTLVVNLAFFRENPRYTPYLEGAPKLTQETVPLLQCVKNLLNDAMPRMRTGDTASFREVRAHVRRQASRLAYGVDAMRCARRQHARAHHIPTLWFATRRRCPPPRNTLTPYHERPSPHCPLRRGCA